jgi:hypothetical protein
MIYTFYSYKGGVGRSMALANVAQWMSLQGLNVLMVDWDLEAPGLEQFFHEQPADLERARAHPGLIDSLLAYKRSYPSIKPRLQEAGAMAPPQPAEPESDATEARLAARQQKVERLRPLLPPLADAILTIRPPSAGFFKYGWLKLLTAGWRAGEDVQDYAAAVQSFDWAEFYAAYDGEAYFDWMRDELNIIADVVLIDSRTGVTEMGGVCTRHLADVVVALCAPNRQNLQGLVDMLRSFRRSRLIAARGRPLDLIVVPTRIENSEITRLNAFASEFTQRLDEFTPAAFRRSQRTFWELRVPYVPRYAYSETLAVGASDTSIDLERAYRTVAAHMLLLAPDSLVDRAGSDLASDVRALALRESQPAVGYIFLSYARSDGEQVADALRDRLSREVTDTKMWSDVESVEGREWRSQIEGAPAARSLIVVLTPAAIASPSLTRAWLEARRKGVSIVPVLGMPKYAVNWEKLPLWLKSQYVFDPGSEWDILVKMLRSDKQPARIPFMVPPRPVRHVPRPSEMESVVHALLDVTADSVAGSAVAIVGAGGTGKSVLAAAVCHDERIIEAFYDGILWTTLGATPQIVPALTELYYALTSERPVFLSFDDAAAALQDVLENRRCLIVVDDVWSETHVRPFLRGGRQCARLITTRNTQLAREGVRVNLGELTSEQAIEMLASSVGGRPVDTAVLAKLADRLDRWPLLLELTSAALYERMSRGDDPEGAIAFAHRALDRRGVTAFDRRGAEARGQAIARTLEASLEVLDPEERRHCEELAAFPEGVDIPLTQAGEFLGLDEFDTEVLAERLDSLSLVHLNLKEGTVSMHPLIRDFLRQSLKNLAAVDERAAEVMNKHQV